MRLFHMTLIGVLLLAAAEAQAAPVMASDALFFRDNEGPNTVGSGEGDNLTIVLRNVAPNLTTFNVFGTNPDYAVALPGSGGKQPMVNLFTSPFGFFSRNFAADVADDNGSNASGPQDLGGVVSSPWTIQAQGLGGVLQPPVVTNGLAGVGQMPLLQNLSVGGPSLAPTVSWDPVVSATPYDQVRVSIYNDDTDQLVVTEQIVGGAGITSFNVAEGVLAPDQNYSFRVFLWDNGGPENLLINRSSTHVQHTATSGDSLSGDVNLTTTSASGPLTLAAGANNLPDTAINVGNTGPGAMTLQNGTTLNGAFLSVGRAAGQPGTLVVDDTMIHLDGSAAFPPANGGFLNVGRGGGRGYVDVVNGGRIEMESDGFVFPGFTVGRDLGSFGNLNVIGPGSSIEIAGPAVPFASDLENGFINVGRGGDGRLNVLDGGQVTNAPNGGTVVGRFAGSRGAVLVSGAGSVLDAGSSLVVSPVGGGEGIVRVEDGGLLKAGEALFGDGSLLFGDGGTVQSDVTLAGGVIAPGASPGLFVIDGDLIIQSGILLLEALGPGQIDRLRVTGDLILGADAQIEIVLGYEPLDTLSFFDVFGEIEIHPDFAGPRVLALLGSDAPVGQEVAVLVGERRYLTNVRTSEVPEPETLGLLAWAAAAAGLLRRRRLLRTKFERLHARPQLRIEARRAA